MRELMVKAVFEPLERLGQQFAQVIPAIITVLVVLIVGGLLGYLVRIAVHKILVMTHFDRLVGRSGLSDVIENTGIFRSASDFAARLAQGIVWLVVILVALDSTGTPMAEALVVRFVNYVPNLVSAGLILLLGELISKFLARSALLAAVNAQWAGARAVAGAVRVMVMALAVAMALEELHIGRNLLIVSFSILFLGIVIAAAIAFGFGARDLAREWMNSKLNRGAPSDSEEVFRHF
jgi:hypothetical protein